MHAPDNNRVFTRSKGVTSMAKFLIIAVSLSVLGLSACANSENKWSREESTSNGAAQSNWQQNDKVDDSQKKSTSTYWNDGNRY